MSMKVNNKKTHLPVNKLFVDRVLNPRTDTYDTPGMVQAIRLLGRITDAVSVEPMPKSHPQYMEGLYRVLKGNRRTLAGQEIWMDPACPSNLKEALEKVQVTIYEDLDDHERLQLVFDHGTQRDLSRAETLTAVFRLLDNDMKAPEVVQMMYTCLARYTGSAKKLSEVEQISDPAKKEKAIKTWLHGTVGNYMDGLRKMGPVLRNQGWLTALEVDRKLSDEEKAQYLFECKASRVTQLSSAKTFDRDGNTRGSRNGTGWEPLEEIKEEVSPEGKSSLKFVGGGATFNKQIEDFIKEDRGGSTEKKDKRLTAVKLVQLSDAAKSKELRAFYAKVGGKEIPGFDFDSLDTEIYRREKVQNELIASLDHIKDQGIKALVYAIAYKGEKEVNAALTSYVS